MSTIKASRQAVKSAAISILEEGEPLSISAVLARTQGSRTTVTRFLGEIRQELATFSAEGMDLPTGLREALIAFERTVWMEARTAAGENFTVERDRLHRYLEEGERNLASLMEINDSLVKTMNAAQRTIEAQAAIMTQRDKELARTKKTVDGLRTRAAAASRTPDATEVIMRELAQIRHRLAGERANGIDDPSDGE